MTVLQFRGWIACVLAAQLLAGQPAQAADWVYDDVERIVAISDIHGAHDAMVRTLQQAGVIDADAAWAGGATHLVIVGDILDRGPDSRQSMDLLMDLEAGAAAAGGRVHVLIGNHEAMNLTGDLRYVSREEYAAFAAEETAEMRDRWFDAYLEKRNDNDAPLAELRTSFDADFPPGFFAHRVAFSATGKYGKWLLTKPIIVVINDTAFVHGGVSPLVGELGLAGVNGMLRTEMAEYVRNLGVLIEAGVLLPTDSFYDHRNLLQGFSVMLTTDEDVAAAITSLVKLADSRLHKLDGPLWYRGNVACNAVIEVDRLDAALDAIGASRVVIGHTPTRGRTILQRFGGRVVEVDTGMLNSYYRGHGNALVIEGGDDSIVGESGQFADDPVRHPRYVGQRPGGLPAEELAELLRTGDILESYDNGAGQTVVSVSDGEHTVLAAFARRVGRENYPAAAAYRLDTLLQFDMVPVTVKREVNGRQGTLQFMPQSLIDEVRRRESGRGGSADCPLPLQWDAMSVFDTLMFNSARFATTIQYDQAGWKLILSGNDRAFEAKTGRPQQTQNVALKLGPHWKTMLGALSDEVLAEVLGDVLDDKRLSALGARRDMLLQMPDQAP